MRDGGPLNSTNGKTGSDPCPPAVNEFQVGEWSVHPSLNRLSRGADEVRVEPKVMQVLEVLAETPTRSSRASNWWRASGQDVFVTDDVLHRAIRELRRVFGDDTANPTYVETIRKRGYRLIAPVARLQRAPVTRHALDARAPTRTRAIVDDDRRRIARARRRSWRRRLCVGAEAVAERSGSGIRAFRGDDLRPAQRNRSRAESRRQPPRLCDATRSGDNGQPISTSPMGPAIRRSASPTMPQTIAIRRGQPMRRCSPSYASTAAPAM